MEKGGGGGGGSQEYTKSVASQKATKPSGSTGSPDDCANVSINTTIMRPILERLVGIEEGSVLQLNFPEREKKIEILNYEKLVCGYVTSSVDRLFECHDKGFRFEVALMHRNDESVVYKILVRNKR